MPAPVYFTAPNGVVYRVLDMRWHDGKRVHADPPAAWATTRIFRTEDGQERYYPLAYLALHPEWTREPTDEMLGILFARSERGRNSPSPTLAARAASSESAAPPAERTPDTLARSP